jgi:hypothetical protein
MEASASCRGQDTFASDEFRASTPTIRSRLLLLGKRQRSMPTAAVGP